MTDSEPTANLRHDAMMRSIGHCLIAWANVEFELGDAFLRFHGDGRVATLVWDSIVSFDARVTMLQRLLKLRFPDGVVHDDTVLLLNETRRMYKQRNEVAHSTLLRISDTDEFVLEPFFVLGNEKPRLTTSDLKARAIAFAKLSISLAWLRMEMDPFGPMSPMQLTTSGQPPTDLIRALRDEESRRRKEQSERQKLLRHALKLAAEGRLPDWPPDLGSVVQSASS